MFASINSGEKWAETTDHCWGKIKKRERNVPVCHIMQRERLQRWKTFFNKGQHCVCVLWECVLAASAYLRARLILPREIHYYHHYHLSFFPCAGVFYVCALIIALHAGAEGVDFFSIPLLHNAANYFLINYYAHRYLQPVISWEGETIFTNKTI